LRRVRTFARSITWTAAWCATPTAFVRPEATRWRTCLAAGPRQLRGQLAVAARGQATDRTPTVHPRRLQTPQRPRPG
jgi:hypothetical protein